MAKAATKEEAPAEKAPEKMVSVFVDKKGIEHHTTRFVDKDGQMQTRHILTLDVNYKKIEIPCGVRTEIPESYLGALQAVLDRQAEVNKQNAQTAGSLLI